MNVNPKYGSLSVLFVTKTQELIHSFKLNEVKFLNCSIYVEIINWMKVIHLTKYKQNSLNIDVRSDECGSNEK